MVSSILASSYDSVMHGSILNGTMPMSMTFLVNYRGLSLFIVLIPLYRFFSLLA